MDFGKDGLAQGNTMKRSTILLAAIVLLLGLKAWSTGTLQVGDLKVEEDTVTIPIVLGGDLDEGVAALDFRLRYDPQTLRPMSAEAGAAAGEAGKRVMANTAEPGEYIVVMMGMNQSTCSTGEVAKIVMERVAEDGGESWGLDVFQPTLSSVEGAVIPSLALPYNPGNEDAGADDAELIPQ